jgi:hypothetical protein
MQWGRHSRRRIRRPIAVTLIDVAQSYLPLVFYRSERTRPVPISKTPQIPPFRKLFLVKRGLRSDESRPPIDRAAVLGQLPSNSSLDSQENREPWLVVPQVRLACSLLSLKYSSTFPNWI